MQPDAPSVMERYAQATRTSDLTVGKSHQGHKDADVLLAAGYAARQGAYGQQALLINRMLVTGDYKQLPMALVIVRRWLMGAMHHRPRVLPMLKSKDVDDVAKVTLKWWLKGVCPHCDGRGHELVYPGAQVTSTRECKPCEGQGRTTLDRIAGQHWEPARWVAARLDLLMDQIEQDMKHALARREA